MRRLLVFTAFLVLSVVAVTAVTAQETCPSFVTQALQDLSNNCGDLARNSACYGFNHVTATFFNGFMPEDFTQPNDRVQLASLESITTSPLNVDTAEWGIAILKVQADIPEALPGQAVTFMLLGDVHLETGVEMGSDQTPMQAVYFTTGIGDTKCNGAPASSLVIQGPENITVNLRVNGANIELGSTAVFQSKPNGEMECTVLDGAARVRGGTQVIPAGFGASVALDEHLNADGNWKDFETLEDDEITGFDVLRRIPAGVLNYEPDVPTTSEVAMLAALDRQLVDTLDPHVLRQIVRLLIAEGAEPESIAALDVRGVRQYLLTHTSRLSDADRQTFTPDVRRDLAAALLDYAQAQ